MVPSTVIYNEYLQKFRRYIRHHEMVLGGEHVLLAVSGGVDSIALLDMMARIAPELKLQIGVAHFDHGLRGEAAHRDASFVVEQARLRGIKAYVGRGDVKKLAAEYKLSIEEAGRKARYAFLKRVAQKHRYSVVMTGHNANDNAETLLMNLLRGSGVKGLAAIPPVRSLMRGVVLARPLLEFEREMIEGYAREMDIEWSEDETNKSPQFLRNRVRAELLPLLKQFNPSIVGTLASTANIMQCLEQYISQTVDHAIERVVTDRTKESLALKLNQLKHYLPAMQTEIVQRSISDVFEIPPISYGAIERTLGLMWKESGSKADVGNGITAFRDRETLEVRRELPPPPPVVRTFRAGESVQVGRTLLRTEILAKEAAVPGTLSSIEFVDAAKVTGELTLRSWKEGDRFRPFGMEGEKKLSDFLIDKKVPLDRKARILVVANGDQIVWVCGMRLDDRYRITAETEKVLRMELEVVTDSNQRSGSQRQQQGKSQGNRPPRAQTAQPPAERGGEGRRDDRRGERRDDDRREGTGSRAEQRPRDRREAEGQGEQRRPDERRSDERRSDERRPGDNDRRRENPPAGDRPSEDQPQRESRDDDRGSRELPRDPRQGDRAQRDKRQPRAEGRVDRRDQAEPHPEQNQPRADERSEGRERAEDRAQPGDADRVEQNDRREPRGDERRDQRRDELPERKDQREPRTEQRRDQRRDERAGGKDRQEPAGEDPRQPQPDAEQPAEPTQQRSSRPERRPRPEPRIDPKPQDKPAPEQAPLLRNEPDWGDELPHGFGDEDYQRGEIPEREPSRTSDVVEERLPDVEQQRNPVDAPAEPVTETPGREKGKSARPRGGRGRAPGKGRAAGSSETAPPPAPDQE